MNCVRAWRWRLWNLVYYFLSTTTHRKLLSAFCSERIGLIRLIFHYVALISWLANWIVLIHSIIETGSSSVINVENVAFLCMALVYNLYCQPVYFLSTCKICFASGQSGKLSSLASILRVGGNKKDGRPPSPIIEMVPSPSTTTSAPSTYNFPRRQHSGGEPIYTSRPILHRCMKNNWLLIQYLWLVIWS